LKLKLIPQSKAQTSQILDLIAQMLINPIISMPRDKKRGREKEAWMEQNKWY